MEYVACVLALIALTLCAGLAVRLMRLESQLKSLEGPSRQALVEPPSRPLQGLRVAVGVTQDYAQPVFANLLRECLFGEDVTEVQLLGTAEVASLHQSWREQGSGPDILIAGEVVCNGYSEIYYTAEFTCSTADQVICTLTEKPPHGDRPINLASDLVARLKTELEKLVSRDDRRRAIRELQGPT